jgi:hypothetical protein
MNCKKASAEVEAWTISRKNIEAPLGLSPLVADEKLRGCVFTEILVFRVPRTDQRGPSHTHVILKGFSPWMVCRVSGPMFGSH